MNMKQYLEGFGLEPGHALMSEGRIWDKQGVRTKKGPARCSCGWSSSDLLTDVARKNAHRYHKGIIRQEQREDEVEGW